MSGRKYLAVLIVCAAQPAARRAAATTVGLLPLKGRAPAAAARAIDDALRRALGAQGLAPIDRAVIERLGELAPASCGEPRCMERLARVVDADLLVGGRVVPGDGDRAEGGWIVQLWLYRRQPAAGDLAVATAQAPCAGRDAPALGRCAGRLLGELWTKARALAAPAKLAVRSSPPGAVVAIDGTPIGVTDMTFGVTPGAHVVTLHLPGRELSVHRLVLEPGARQQIVAQLQPGVRHTRRGRVLGWVKWTLVGVAAATLGVGVALWAKGRESAAPSSTGVEPSTLRNYRPAGIALTSIGVASGAAAIAAFVIDARHEGARSVAVAAAPSGAVVSYAGRF